MIQNNKKAVSSLIIGLTGSSGSGKSVAADFFRQKGFFVIDYDKLTYEVYKKGEPCLNELTAAFGNDIINDGGNLIRKKLGDIVFCDKAKLDLLNNICMKHILIKSEILIDSNKDKNILLDAPLLFESGLDKICDKVIGIIADKNIQLERIVKRDNISIQTAEGRINSQHDNQFFIQNCDYCFENNSTPEKLQATLEILLEDLYDNCE